MAYIIWSKDQDCIVNIVQTLDEVKHHNATEKELDSFSLYSMDENKYYCHAKLDVKRLIYIFTFIESGGYHRTQYVRLSNSYDEILETATEFFINESEDNKQSDIEQMLTELKANNSYEIPHGRSYECDMYLKRVLF